MHDDDGRKKKEEKLGQKLVGANNNQTDQMENTLTLLPSWVIVKSGKQEKGVKVGETVIVHIGQQDFP
jgi:hypothetical protein